MKNYLLSFKKWLSLTAIFLFTVITASLSGCEESACHKIVHESIQRVECKGSCPSENQPNCYIKFRKENSEDDWQKTTNSKIDKTPGMEYACYCDT